MSGSEDTAKEFVGEALPLGDDDYEEVSGQLGCELAAIKAVAQVESRGKGFLSDNRPKILFEAHVFSRLTGHKYDVTHKGISSRTWNKNLYKGGADEYTRLSEAIDLDRSAALQSASWGKFQIMGYNYVSSGFKDVETFVAAMCRSEGEHLRAAAAFIKSNPSMVDSLVNKHWQTFAELYNGAGYKANSYDDKLKEAYEAFVG
jgi:hypothetical protein